jgi:hypothetical protein
MNAVLGEMRGVERQHEYVEFLPLAHVGRGGSRSLLGEAEREELSRASCSDVVVRWRRGGAGLKWELGWWAEEPNGRR